MNFNLLATSKDTAAANNYKLKYFEQLSSSKDIADLSALKKYFDNVMGTDGSNFSSFQSELSANFIVADNTRKSQRLYSYRNMANNDKVEYALSMICYNSKSPNENNEVIWPQITNDQLDPADVEYIKDACYEYLNLFDLDHNFYEYMKTFIVEGQLCWENIIAKDELDAGIIGVNLIPNDAYEFAYDLSNKRKAGIVINSITLQEFGVFNQFYQDANSISINVNQLNCGKQINEKELLFMPFEQLTYMDVGRYDSTKKIVYSHLEYARRAYNQLVLIEDSILIYRVTRSPERYVFNVDIGRLNKARGSQEVEKLKRQFGTRKTWDSSTATVNKTYDAMQMSESFWFIQGANGGGVKVDTLSSPNAGFGQIDDLKYFLNSLYNALKIPKERINEANVEVHNSPDHISSEELHFVKFIMDLQSKFAQGLLNGLITHLRLKGIWDAYKLSKNDLDVIINPPIEYDIYRRQKLLETKIAMLKEVVGDKINDLFSTTIALEMFMGWDADTIKKNSDLVIKEKIEKAKLEYIISKLAKDGKTNVQEFINTIKDQYVKDNSNVQDQLEKNKPDQDDNTQIDKPIDDENVPELISN